MIHQPCHLMIAGLGSLKFKHNELFQLILLNAQFLFTCNLGTYLDELDIDTISAFGMRL